MDVVSATDEAKKAEIKQLHSFTFLQFIKEQFNICTFLGAYFSR
jgi:hypothetical protein